MQRKCVPVSPPALQSSPGTDAEFLNGSEKSTLKKTINMFPFEDSLKRTLGNRGKQVRVSVPSSPQVPSKPPHASLSSFII